MGDWADRESAVEGIKNAAEDVSAHVVDELEICWRDGVGLRVTYWRRAPGYEGDAWPAPGSKREREVVQEGEHE